MEHSTDARLLIIDDDRGFTAPLVRFVTSIGFQITVCESLASGQEEIDREAPDILLLDVILPDGSGIDLLKSKSVSKIKKVIFVTAHPYVETELGSLQNAGHVVLAKPVDPEALKRALLGNAEAQFSKPRLVELAKFRQPFDRMVGRSQIMLDCYRSIEQAAASDAVVFLRGEAGTGKELVARTIHSLSARRDQPFVKLNCAGLQEDDALSVLFGSKAESNAPAKDGFLKTAEGGTLFLKNINALPLHAQEILSEFFDGKEKSNAAAINVRVIVSSYSELEPDTAGLSPVLLDRLLQNAVILPALRDHKEDIPLFAEYFLYLLNDRADENKKMTDKTLVTLMHYYWPGNVRELRNILQQAFILASSDTIDEQLVGDRMAQKPEDASEKITLNIGDSIAKAEKVLILNTMEKTDGNKAAAAKLLGISLKTLYNKLDLYTRNDRFA